MLDIKFIRENKELIELAAKKKRVSVDLNRLCKLDDQRIFLGQQIDEIRAKQNMVSKRIPEMTSDSEKAELIKSMGFHKEDLKKFEEELRVVMEEWRTIMLQVPNIPDTTVPEGAGEEDNVEILTWGEKPNFDFEPKDHVELMLDLDMVDFERGVKVHGFRGYFLKNDGAELSWAIWNYARKFFGEKKFNTFIAPIISRKEHLIGTGHLPGGAEDIYQTQDDDYLAGTAEIPMMGYHSNETLLKSELPKRYLAFSPCYRREAGSYGKDTKGLIRVQEFYKLEQLILCEASHAESVKYHEEINRNFEEFLESLNIPYRRLEICTGDLKGAHVKSYDTEAWVPSQNQYRELSSASYYHDFQCRRFNIRYTDENGKNLFAHSLNCTAVATPRILVAIAENYQQADGSIKIPDALVPYFGKSEIRKK
jgi:seryl-tRNA synthetase